MFGNPMFLWALLACAVPVLIHLIFRRKRKQIFFPSLRFLKRVDLKLTSRRKLRELLLLLLRVLALACVALALARPGLRAAGQPHGSFGTSADAVLIVDNSASMGLPVPAGSSAGGTRLDAARLRATAALSGLGPEGRAALVFTVPDYTGESEQDGELTGEFSRTQATLKRLRPTAGAGRLSVALARAGELLSASSSTPQREVYIFTDLQANLLEAAPLATKSIGESDAAEKQLLNVADSQEALHEALSKLPANTHILLCPVPTAPTERNLGLAGVTLDPRPKISGRIMTLAIKVVNPSRKDLATTVSAQLNGLPPESVPVSLAPEQSSEIAIRLKLGQEGFAWGEVKLQDDEVSYDNVWPFCVDVRGPVRVLSVSPRDAAKREDDEDFFLAKALDPTGDGRLSGIHVERAKQDFLPANLAGTGGAAGLASFQAVLLCGCTALQPETLDALEKFVKLGGGLMIFAGPKDVALGVKQPLRSLSGVTILGELVSKPGEKPPGLRALQPASPYFEDCRDAEGRVEFKDAAILRALKVQPAQDALALAELSNGEPALLVRTLERGRVLYWAFSAHARDGNLPLQPAFLSLLHRSISEVCGTQSTAVSRTAGTPLTLDFPLLKKDSVSLYDPEQHTFLLPLVDGRMSWKGTGRAGVYHFGQDAGAGAGSGTARVKGFALTPDPTETTAAYLNPHSAVKALGAQAELIPAETDLAAALAGQRKGSEFFGILILLGLCALLGEAFLANQTAGVMKKQSGADRTDAAG